MSSWNPLLTAAQAQFQAGCLDESERFVREILSSELENAEAWHLLGLIAHERQLLSSAVQFLRRAFALSPENASILNSLGLALHDQGIEEEAAECFRGALKLRPEMATACYNLGNLYLDQGKYEQAAEFYQRAIGLRGDDAEAHHNLGAVFFAQRSFQQAAQWLQKAVAIKQNFPEALNLLGSALRELGLGDQAESCCRRAVELKPDFAEAQLGLGNALYSQGNFLAAAEQYSAALQLNPDFSLAHNAQAHLWLLHGNWDRGWQEYEWRSKSGELAARSFRQPLWNGQRLDGRTILLHAEQGLGDTIQFIRYASAVKERGGTVVVECQSPLTQLLARCPGVDRLIVADSPQPGFDVHAPLLSLPRIFGTTLVTIPARVPYVFVDESLTIQWREKIRQVVAQSRPSVANRPVAERRSGSDAVARPPNGATSHLAADLLVGVAWRGRGVGAFRQRDIPLRLFMSLARLPGIRLITLQKEGREELELATEKNAMAAPGPAGASMYCVEDDIDTVHGAFVDTAAIMLNLDLIITSDTSIAHLAGALGVPVWLALPLVPDWRWLLDRADSPWYPTMRLFRQTVAGDWGSVFEEIGAAITELVLAEGQR